MSATILGPARLPGSRAGRHRASRDATAVEAAVVRDPGTRRSPFVFQDYSDDDLPPANTVVQGSNLFSWLVGKL